MPAYRLKFLEDADDSNPKKFESETIVRVGEVIQVENGFFHCVVKITDQKTGVRLDLAKSSQSREEAILVAEQHGHLPES